MPRPLKFGYGRVSTKDQHLDVQEASLNAVCDKVYLEKKSGTTRERPVLAEVLARLDAGDVLVVTKLDRLARSIADLYHIVEQLKQRGAHLEVLDQPMDIHSFTGKILFTFLGLMAELETSLRHERQMAGIRAAQAKGKLCGRAKKLTPQQALRLRQQRQHGTTIAELMTQYGLKRAAIYRYLAQGNTTNDAALDAAD